MRRRLVWLAATVWLCSLVTCNVVRARRGSADAPVTVGTAALLSPSSQPSPGISGARLAQQPAALGTTASSGAPAPDAPSLSPSTAGGSAVAPLSAMQTAATSPSPTAPSLAEGISATSSGATPVQGSAAAPLGGARPSTFSTIQGNALRATGAALARATVRLRDARFGRIAGTQTSDQSGLFAFSAVDPGVYVVEIVGEDGSVLAASQMLNVTAGDTASTAVRLPFRALPLGGVFGDSTPAAAIVAAEAAAAGVLTTTTTQPVSPTQ